MVGGVEPVERIDVAERQRERAVLGLHTGFEQPLERPGAAQLVAVNQRADEHMAAGLARVEMPYAFGACVACAPGRDVGRGQFKSQRCHGFAYSSILANCTILVYLAISSFRNF
ncbi:hypothetical protein SDC9_139188 [bioreactor metagenome]|uniref:Uncharacterized protein n=1 Tax=bioreactor metagenome TaxID=1076179 RepID=A0A645DRF1_9ZZZZ